MSSGPDEEFEARLRDQLVRAAEQRNSRRARRMALGGRLAAIAILVASAAAVAVNIDAPRSEAAALRIEHDGELIAVRIEDLTAKPEQVTAELEQEGLDVRVQSVPVADPMIGRFVQLDIDGSLRPGNVEQQTFRDFVVDTSVSRSLRLSMGRAARGNESYAAPFDAYAEGGPLRCSGAWGRTASQAESIIAERFDGQVRWKSVQPNGSIADTTPSSAPALYVVDAHLISRRDLNVYLAPSPESPFVQSGTQGPIACD